MLQADLRRPQVLLRAAAGALTRLRIEVRRRAAADLDLWERRQNYRAFSDTSGMVDLIECSLLITRPDSLVEELRRQPVPSDAVAATVRAWRESGEVRLGAPLAVVGHPGSGSRREIALRIDRARIDLLIDGRLIDSEWPCGPWISGDDDVTIGAGVEQFRAWDRVVDDAERGWTRGADPVLAQHWAPSGHNVFAGDTMWCVSGDRLHLYWLPDHRAGESKWGAGVGQFAHHSTTDLHSWTAHPLAYPLTEPHELALGTGAVIEQDGVFHLYSRHCQERFGPAFEALHPGGMHHATSTDGETFIKLGPCPISGSGRTRHDLGAEPGMLRDAAGLWHAAAAGTRLTSSDLHRWTVTDAEFLPPVGWPCTRYLPPVGSSAPASYVVSNECTCWFRWGDWHYLLSGRTGFWMSRSLLGPYWGAASEVVHPAWDPYDGLLVPQAIVFKQRCVLSGWLARSEGYAGHLVFRELIQRPDGNLEMRRLPELEPRCGESLRWTAPAEPDVASAGGRLIIDARAAARSAVISGVESDIRIAVRLRPEGCARYGLSFLASAPSAPSCELRLEPRRSLAQWGTALGGLCAPDSVGLPFDGRDFSILGVDGLDRAIALDILVRREPKSRTTIIDAEIDGRRTMITRRDEDVGGLSFWADSGRLVVERLEIRRITDRIGG
jgi:hypothetical protein